VKYIKATEFKNLKSNIELALSMPFIGPIDGELWERVLADVKGAEQFSSKKLFDLVDRSTKEGWSVKTIFGKPLRGAIVSPIIARIRVFELYDLDLDSDPQVIGDSLIEFWNDKVKTHSKLQNVEDKFISILIKGTDLVNFAYFEKRIDVYNPDDFIWSWSEPRKDYQPGLVGFPKNRDYWKFRWEPTGHQFFEKWLIPPEAHVFKIEVKKKSVEDLKRILLN
jgi:hypothetical protein